MPSIQPGGLGYSDEELRSVGVGAGVGHGEPALAVVLQGEVLIFKLITIDGFATST